MGSIRRVLISLVALAALAIPAFAAAPSNDDRSDARALSVPSRVEGTTREATRDSNDPGSSCGSPEETVWYSLDPAETQQVSIELAARGDLEAVLEVFRRDRSNLEPVDCDRTNRRGDASVQFKAEKDQRYLVRVGQRFDSEPGDFVMDVFSPEPEATPPGPRLPDRGGSATVDRAHDLTDAWSKRLVAGRSYVVTLASRSDACPSVGVFEPGIGGFDGADNVDGSACNAHNLFTPERGGRYSFLVRAGRGERGAQRYLLRVRAARRDDTSPGRTIRNYEVVKGRVGPRRADVVDLLRFHVNRRSDVELRFQGRHTLELRNVRGRLMSRQQGFGIRTQLRRGRYYAVVRSGARGGAYRLQPAIRDITRSRIAFNGRHEAVISPGQAATASVRVTPAGRGKVRIVVQRLDPLEGWQFFKRFVVRTSSGRASGTFVPRRAGRFRARAEYGGSRLSAPSETGYAYLSAREPF